MFLPQSSSQDTIGDPTIPEHQLPALDMADFRTLVRGVQETPALVEYMGNFGLPNAAAVHGTDRDRYVPKFMFHFGTKLPSPRH